ncbi:hypothetical protein NEIRO03_1796 [Nematocida sp. AWRm78]|nr:hypothetical protein NEIRO02_1515 [Nematocida sp. AWRm79]KAI5184668.1 hypothetical protein NEIRO03_1796 [Nematocida sp. AWRm78]
MQLNKSIPKLDLLSDGTQYGGINKPEVEELMKEIEEKEVEKRLEEWRSEASRIRGLAGLTKNVLEMLEWETIENEPKWRAFRNLILAEVQEENKRKLEEIVERAVNKAIGQIVKMRIKDEKTREEARIKEEKRIRREERIREEVEKILERKKQEEREEREAEERELERFKGMLEKIRLSKPIRCYTCKRLGHRSTTCMERKKDKPASQNNKRRSSYLSNNSIETATEIENVKEPEKIESIKSERKIKT